MPNRLVLSEYELPKVLVWEKYSFLHPVDTLTYWLFLTQLKEGDCTQTMKLLISCDISISN